MIVTLTANPSLDRTVTLPGPLSRGQVQRALTTTSDPGGKGVNVARVATAAGALAGELRLLGATVAGVAESWLGLDEVLLAADDRAPRP